MKTVWYAYVEFEVGYQHYRIAAPSFPQALSKLLVVVPLSSIEELQLRPLQIEDEAPDDEPYIPL